MILQTLIGLSKFILLFVAPGASAIIATLEKIKEIAVIADSIIQLVA